jgi:hypothetical protein
MRMSDEHDNHGSTPAAWTAVTIIMIAFAVGAIGVVMASAPLFWVGAALIVVGLVVGKVMSMMGMGAKPVADHSDHADHSTATAS